jgi:hypothetical protein
LIYLFILNKGAEAQRKKVLGDERVLTKGQVRWLISVIPGGDCEDGGSRPVTAKS